MQLLLHDELDIVDRSFFDALVWLLLLLLTFLIYLDNSLLLLGLFKDTYFFKILFVFELGLLQFI